MPVQQDDQDVDQLEDAWYLPARQWRRAAVVLAFLFASLPLTGKLLLGSWRFDGALELACICLIAAAYFHFAGRKSQDPIPDSALMLGAALQFEAAGERRRALALLDQAILLDPDLWQARQYRGQMQAREPEGAEIALADFTEAIRLAPDEPYLYLLRSQVFAMLGRESSARADLETAARGGDDAGTSAKP